MTSNVVLLAGEEDSTVAKPIWTARRRSLLLVLGGGVLVVAGVSLVAIPVAIVLAGLGIGGLGLLSLTEASR
jgi:hypothetical protein